MLAIENSDNFMLQVFKTDKDVDIGMLTIGQAIKQPLVKQHAIPIPSLLNRYTRQGEDNFICRVYLYTLQTILASGL